MIRRWSRITHPRLNTTFYSNFFFKFKFKSFRKAIIFKKFFTLYSKILRKHYSRMKHSYNWLIYTQIWQHWVKDFLKIKTIAKFFYFKKFHYLEIFSYDPYRLNTKQQKLISSISHLSCGLPRSLMLWNYHQSRFPYYYHWNSKIFKNGFLHFSYLLSYNVNEKIINNSPLPISLVFENSIISPTLLPNKYNLITEFTSIFDEIFTTCLQLYKEFYKILIYLWLDAVFQKDLNLHNKNVK